MSNADVCSLHIWQPSQATLSLFKRSLETLADGTAQDLLLLALKNGCCTAEMMLITARKESL
jgi:hypothetical protein